MFPLCVANSFILDFFYNFSDIFSLARIVFWKRVLVACLHQKKPALSLNHLRWLLILHFDLPFRPLKFQTVRSNLLSI